jgi:hypothetical protein
MKPLKYFPFTPILGWSASRYDTFQACKRQYFYTYYAKYDPVCPRQKIDALKRMTTIPLETGHIVHGLIEDLLKRLLKTEAEIDPKRLLDYARRKTLDYCGRKVFAEAYYGEIPRVDADGIFDKVKACTVNFMDSERFDWLTGKAILTKRDWLIEPGGYGETRIDNMKAYCKVDFLFPADDRIFILDWKTGKPNERRHRRQLIGYSSWASFHLSKDPSHIVPVIAYLHPFYSEKELTLNEFDIREFSLQVRTETEEMYAFCTNVQENIPGPKEGFPKTANGNICDYCNFRELCR